MIKRVVIFVSLALLPGMPWTASGQPATITGPELAAKLCGLRPEKSATYAAALKVRPHKQRTEVLPVSMKVELEFDSWKQVYQCQLPDRIERLTVVHRPGKPNEYLHASTAPGELHGGEPKPVERSGLGRPFAGSDFWFCDLGQEFFHWPQQRILKNEMRKSRSCKVLESRPAHNSEYPYSRVVSWIDNETGGLVMAEAYDREDRLLKEFEVRNVRKVEEEYRADLQIWNVQTKSRTRLDFGEE